LLVWCAAGPPIEYSFDALCNHSSTSPKLSNSLQTVLLFPKRPARLPNLTNMQTIEIFDGLFTSPLISGCYVTIIGVHVIIRPDALTWFPLFPPSTLRCSTSICSLAISYSLTICCSSSQQQTSHTYRGADKFLARLGRKQANVFVRMEWISFGTLPCRKKNLMTACVSMFLKSRASLTCFRDCVLPGRAKDLSAPRYIKSDTFGEV